MATYGYARVSSLTQDYSPQVAALTKAGCEEIIGEKVSGKDAEGRERLQALLAQVAEGDIIVVTKLDRFARNTRELLNMLHDLGERGVGFKSLGDPVDTTTPQGRLVTQIFAALAEFERALIRERCAIGTAAAKARGVKWGRKHKLTPHQRNWVVAQLAAGASQRELARQLNVDQSTISRMAAKGTLQGMAGDGVDFGIELAP
jgi:DNA invertase Pin-like site-specific DNA recombinase